MKFDFTEISDGLPFSIQIVRLFFYIIILLEICSIISNYYYLFFIKKSFKTRKIILKNNETQSDSDDYSRYKKSKPIKIILNDITGILNILDENLKKLDIKILLKLLALHTSINRILTKKKLIYFISTYVSIILMIFIFFIELNAYVSSEIYEKSPIKLIFAMVFYDIEQIVKLFLIINLLSMIGFILINRLNDKLCSKIEKIFQSKFRE